jgi:hypothetical protein
LKRSFGFRLVLMILVRSGRSRTGGGASEQ